MVGDRWFLPSSWCNSHNSITSWRSCCWGISTLWASFSLESSRRCCSSIWFTRLVEWWRPSWWGPPIDVAVAGRGGPVRHKVGQDGQGLDSPDGDAGSEPVEGPWRWWSQAPGQCTVNVELILCHKYFPQLCSLLNFNQIIKANSELKMKYKNKDFFYNLKKIKHY